MSYLPTPDDMYASRPPRPKRTRSRTGTTVGTSPDTGTFTAHTWPQSPRAHCPDCDWIGDPRPSESHVSIDLRSHKRSRDMGKYRESRARAPRCPAVLADERRRALRVQRAAETGIAAEFPSINWGVEEWAIVFDRYPHVFDAMTDGLAHMSTRWLAGDISGAMPIALVRANEEADRIRGIR